MTQEQKNGQYRWMIALWAFSIFLGAQVGAATVPVPAVSNAMVPVKKTNVVTTLDVIASLARQIGGDRVSVTSLSTAAEDPHFVKPKPSFLSALRNADVLFSVGRSLELWLPQVIQSSGNAKLISGGRVVAVSKNILAIEVPKVLSREGGDVHPEGNPHVWLSPLDARIMAQNIRDELMKIDPTNKATYEKNFKDFELALATALYGPAVVKAAGTSVSSLFTLQQGGKLSHYLAQSKVTLGGWLARMRQVKTPFFTYHKVFSYFARDFGIAIVGHIEDRPGIVPTRKHLNELNTLAKEKGVKSIIDASYYRGVGGKAIETLATEIGAKVRYVNVDCAAGQSYLDFMGQLVAEFESFVPNGVPKPAATSTTEK